MVLDRITKRFPDEITFSDISKAKKLEIELNKTIHQLRSDIET